MTTTVYLIRHAEYENPKQVNPGRLPGFHLSHLGKKQSENLAKIFVKLPICAVYSSPLERTRETAESIAKKLNLSVITDERLLEVRSPFDGRPIKETNVITSFYTQKYYKAGLERLTEIFRRMNNCMQDIIRRHAGECVIVVSHGDPIMTVLFRYRGLTFPTCFATGSWYVPQASGFKIEFNAAGSPTRITKLSINASKSR